MRTNGKWIALLGTAAILLSPTMALAAEKSMTEMENELDAMKQKIEVLEQKIDESKANDAVVKWEPAPSIKSPDGNFEMNLRGRIYTDAAWISDDENAIDVEATEFRAARLGIEGHAAGNVKYKFEVDFAGDEVTIKDSYLQVKTDSGFAITVGQFKTPNSLDEQTSSRHISVMERASFTDAFGLARRIGLGLSTGGDNWTAKLGVYRGDADTGMEDEGHEIAGRATFSPEFNDVQLHFGGSFRLRNAGDGADYKYSQRPHLHLSPAKFVSSGSVGPEDTLYGVEFGALSGPFWAAAEYAQLKADDKTPASDPTFGGGYVEVGYFFTGESRGYKASKGAWDRPKVNNALGDGGMGALAGVVRYDIIDLTDESWTGGTQDTYVLGLNWYLNRYTRFIANYSHSKIKDGFNVAANGLDGKNEVDGFGLRAQIDW